MNDSCFHFPVYLFCPQQRRCGCRRACEPVPNIDAFGVTPTGPTGCTGCTGPTGPTAPSIYAQQGKCRNHAAFSTLKTIKHPL